MFDYISSAFKCCIMWSVTIMLLSFDDLKLGLNNMRLSARTRSEGPIAFVKTNIAAILDCLESLNSKSCVYYIYYHNNILYTLYMPRDETLGFLVLLNKKVNRTFFNLSLVYRLLDSLVVECWLRVRESPRFNPQSRTASYQIRYKNGTSSTLV